MSISNNDLNLIETINKYIKNDEKLNNIFNHHNQKYSLEELLKHIIFILKTGIAFRNISNYTFIHWNTIYKFFQKLCKYDVFNKVQQKTVTNYLASTVVPLKNKKIPYLLYTDTTLIPNKLGGELLAYNPQLKKHKSTKISIITDMFCNPISSKITASNSYDSNIFKTHLYKLQKKQPILFNSNNIVFGDATYDSSILKKTMGELITPVNIPNTKNANN